MRGGGRTAGSARITAILVSAVLHLAAAAFVIGGGPETPPAPAPRTTAITAAITLLPPVSEPDETASAPVPPPLSPPRKAEQTHKAAPRPLATVPAPKDEAAMTPAILPLSPSVVETITPPPHPVPPVNADAIRGEYARRLWQWIAARRPQGLQRDGEAVVAFRVTRGGGISDLELARSSGSQPLDRLALRTVRLSAPVPAPPEALPDDTLRFTLTFHFR